MARNFTILKLFTVKPIYWMTPYDNMPKVDIVNSRSLLQIIRQKKRMIVNNKLEKDREFLTTHLRYLKIYPKTDLSNIEYNNPYIGMRVRDIPLINNERLAKMGRPRLEITKIDIIKALDPLILFCLHRDYWLVDPRDVPPHIVDAYYIKRAKVETGKLMSEYKQAKPALEKRINEIKYQYGV